MVINVGSILKDLKGNEYKLESILGEGRLGYVYGAIRRGDNARCAVKALPPYFRGDANLTTFKNDMALAAQVNSPNAIRYLFAHNGLQLPDLPPYVIMEYAGGGSLRDLLQKQASLSKHFSNEELTEMYRQLAGGMKAVNEKLTHRDIKPENILVDGSTLKIADYGLSQIATEHARSQSHKGFGSFQYTAPEAWDSGKDTVQTDIYSMGIVFYELATLQHPWEVGGQDMESWKNTHRYSSPKNIDSIHPEVSPALKSLILRMIEKPADKRFGDWDEILAGLSSGQKSDVPYTGLLENMLKKRTDADLAAQAAKTQEKALEKQRDGLFKLARYQFEKDILAKLAAFVANFNAKYPGGKIQMKYEDTVGQHICATIDLFGEKSVKIEAEALHHANPYMAPKCNDRKILCWGRVSAGDERGFNILLLENEETGYGDWFTMTCTNNLSGMNRPEPFGFRLEELPKEIHRIRMVHIYRSVVEAMEENALFDFISRYIA